MDKENLRLNQAISRLGFCSRRKADEYIQNKLVKVNNKVVTDLSCKVDVDRDKIEVENYLLKKGKLEYVLLNKPKNYITTCDDEQNRQTVIDLLPSNLKHLKPIGRLDRNTRGLLILTNDGYFANRLAHPKYSIIKEYHAKISPVIKPQDIVKLSKGVKLSDGITKPAIVKLISKDLNSCVISIKISQGKNRQIRRMCEALNYNVIDLTRVAIGSIKIDNLQCGTYRNLLAKEIKLLMG